jgi:hypothetical protein
VRAVPRLFDGFQPPHDFGKARFVERRADHNRRPARAARKHGHHLMAIERGGAKRMEAGQVTPRKSARAKQQI